MSGLINHPPFPVRCPDCGPVSIHLDGAVTTYSAKVERITFTCPRCHVIAGSFIHPAWVNPLLEVGVPYVELPPRPTITGKQFTGADGDALADQLDAVAFVAALAEVEL